MYAVGGAGTVAQAPAAYQYSSGGGGGESYSDSNNSSKNKRRKKQDIERALLAGDTGALTEDTAQGGLSSYNPNWHGGVSATAKRKGQIGALMANAARMEEVMHREKAKLGKTKRQTNAKYGW
ncbi:hypothetical protein TrRE_jg6952 [Triparma retinervis]|uniref:Uncharacterized protein n=1 Tax=Triparma retinervis TaxID=2557542 RepID=A0A9W7A6S8_9STRA|nr:hypothetical protein TrRE_jg6952 [Triparma retinervis]